MKNDQLCISKNKKKLQRKAQFGQVKNAFEAIHSDSKAKIVTFVVDKFMKIVENALRFTLQMDYEKSNKSKLNAEGSQNDNAKHV